MVSRDHCSALVIVPDAEDTADSLAGPGRSPLSREVVKHQYLNRLDVVDYRCDPTARDPALEALDERSNVFVAHDYTVFRA